MVRRTAEILFAMALLAVAAGCSSSGRAGGTSAASPTQMTGVQLKAALLPASDFPPGYSVLGEQDSGASLAGPRAGVDLNTMSCSYFVSHSTVALVGATAYAAEGLRSRDRSVEYTQVILRFASPAAAAAVYRDTLAVRHRCPRTTVTEGGVTGRVTIQGPPPADVGGHSSVEIDEALTMPGASIVNRTLWSADGQELLEVSVGTIAQGARAPQSPSLRTLMQDLMTTVQAIR